MRIFAQAAFIICLFIFMPVSKAVLQLILLVFSTIGEHIHAQHVCLNMCSIGGQTGETQLARLWLHANCRKAALCEIHDVEA